MWTFPSLESIGQDVRYAVRSLVRSPGFASVALLSLAIGIGGNTAVFSLVDAVRTQALPYREPERLVILWGNVQRERVERRGNSYPDFLDWQARATSYEGLAAVENGFITLDAGGESERLRRQGVSAAFFPLLGVNAALGRTFSADEDSVAERRAVAVLSDGLWRRRFGADPQILGRRVLLDAQPFEVVGVLPPGFKGIEEADLWTPFVTLRSPGGLSSRGSRGFPALGRLKPGVSLAQAQSEIDAISRQLERAYPETNEKRGVEVIPFDVEVFGSIRPAIRTLMGAVIFVLLIACANVGNLLVARSERRQREMAVRTALGAARGRLLRQLITESLVLTSIGGAAGLLVAHFTIRALVAASPIALPGVADPHIDPRAAAFTAGVMLVCGVLLGLAPAMHARVSRLAEALKDSARGSDGRRSHRLRSGLVVAEVGLAVVLLVGAALMIRSVRNLAGAQSRVQSGPGADAADQHSPRKRRHTRCSRHAGGAAAPGRRWPHDRRTHQGRARRRAGQPHGRCASRRQQQRAILFGRRAAGGERPERAEDLRAPRDPGLLRDVADPPSERPAVHRTGRVAHVDGGRRQRARRETLLARSGSDRQADQDGSARRQRAVAVDRRRRRRSQIRAVCPRTRRPIPTCTSRFSIATNSSRSSFARTSHPRR